MADYTLWNIPEWNMEYPGMEYGISRNGIWNIKYQLLKKSVETVLESVLYE